MQKRGRNIKYCSISEWIMLIRSFEGKLKRSYTVSRKVIGIIGVVSERLPVCARGLSFRKTKISLFLFCILFPRLNYFNLNMSST